MISRFGDDTALLLIDLQVGVDVLTHWGGPNGRRNNPAAEQNALDLLAAWRAARRQVAWTLHDSREAGSPLKLALPTGALKPGFVPANVDIVVSKSVNSAFIGTNLEVELRRRAVCRIVIAGFFTNMCVETSVRMAGNLGYDTYLLPEACATTNRIGPDGIDRDPQAVHDASVANLHGEFCTALTVGDVLALLADDAPDLNRVQGNE